MGQALLVVFGVTLVAFVTARLLPGNPVYLMAGSHADERTLTELRARYGLDQPISVQYLRYVSDLARGDWGNAWTTSNPVLEDIVRRFPATLELSLLALTVSLLFAIPVGIGAARYKGSLVDRLASAAATAGASVPQFWLGLMLIYIFFYRLQWVPPPMGRLPLAEAPPPWTGLLLVDTLLAGRMDLFLLAGRALLLPTLTLAFAVQAPILSLVRETMRKTLVAPPVVAGRALGLHPAAILYRRAFRLALGPIASIVGITFGYLLGGTVLVETVFSWPGMGQYALSAMNAGDYAAIQGVVLSSALVYVFVYFALDTMQMLLDPRTRH
ncbi:MAG TPA: ABC transporter permease [Vicinamibacteria bacterium]|jgi:peptide/nickel transport system permease protein